MPDIKCRTQINPFQLVNHLGDTCVGLCTRKTRYIYEQQVSKSIKLALNRSNTWMLIQIQVRQIPLDLRLIISCSLKQSGEFARTNDDGPLTR